MTKIEYSRKVEPIKPDEVVAVKPPEVIEVFNQLIESYWDGQQAKFKQEEAVALIAAKMELDRKALFEHHFLDVEEVYRQAGWDVYYDKPGYDESYPATFTFSKPE